MSRFQLFVPLLIFLALALLLGIGLQKETDELPSALIGKPLPEFYQPSLKDPNRLVSSETFKGKPYLLNVWATWCPSCRAEHAMLLRLAEAGVPIIGINYKDDRDEALVLLTETGDPYEANIYDPDGRLGLDLGVYGAPETFIVDAEGIVRYKLVGVVTENTWKEKMAPLFYEL